MKISYNWLKQFIKIDWNSEEAAALLTDLGLEVEVVEKYQSIKGGLEGIVVGHVLTCIPHPDADRLKLTTVDIGTGTSKTTNKVIIRRHRQRLWRTSFKTKRSKITYKKLKETFLNLLRHLN